MTWGRDAACRETDPEVFFPVPTTPRRDIIAAKRICAGCPEREPCLEYAIAHRVEGIWGGTTEKDRAQLRPVQGNECRNGHPRTQENTAVRKNGSRECLPCRREANERWLRKGRVA